MIVCGVINDCFSETVSIEMSEKIVRNGRRKEKIEVVVEPQNRTNLLRQKDEGGRETKGVEE